MKTHVSIQFMMQYAFLIKRDLCIIIICFLRSISHILQQFLFANRQSQTYCILASHKFQNLKDKILKPFPYRSHNSTQPDSFYEHGLGDHAENQRCSAADRYNQAQPSLANVYFLQPSLDPLLCISYSLHDDTA